MQKSKYQLDIDRTFIEEDCNMAISAVAGSGKTTTLLFLLEVARGHTIFMAFNKSIVDELKDRVPKSDFIEVATSHSIGFRSLNRYYKKSLKLNNSKVWNIGESINKSTWKLPKKKFISMMKNLQDTYNVYRVTLSPSISKCLESASQMGIEFKMEYLDKFSQLIAHIDVYNKNPVEIDFTDMIYLPATLPVPLPTPDNLFIDEAQDLNAAQHKMVDKMRSKGRFVSVGDERQSIYLFAGSHSSSFKLFVDKPNTKSLPLSVCYRCGKEIIKYAQRYNPEIEAFDNNHDGEVRWGDVREINEKDMVICRNLRPLIEVFFKLIDNNKRAFIKGKDIGKGLIKILSNLRDDQSIKELVEFSQKLRLIMFNKLVEKGIDNPILHPLYINLIEKLSVILKISLKFNSVKEIREFIEHIFSDNTKDDSVVLSTIHKAKGLECDRVFFLDRHLIPSSYAKNKEQLKQEDNLYYVGITRAKHSLIFISTNATNNDDEYIKGFKA